MAWTFSCCQCRQKFDHYDPWRAYKGTSRYNRVQKAHLTIEDWFNEDDEDISDNQTIEGKELEIELSKPNNELIIISEDVQSKNSGDKSPNKNLNKQVDSKSEKDSESREMPGAHGYKE